MSIIKYNQYVAVISAACASDEVPLMCLQATVLSPTEGLKNSQVTLFPGKRAANCKAHTAGDVGVLSFAWVSGMSLLHHGLLLVIGGEKAKKGDYLWKSVLRAPGKLNLCRAASTQTQAEVREDAFSDTIPLQDIWDIEAAWMISDTPVIALWAINISRRTFISR